MIKHLKSNKGIVDILIISAIMGGFLGASFLYDFGFIKPSNPPTKIEATSVTGTEISTESR